MINPSAPLRAPELTLSDLVSGEPARIRAALDDLRSRREAHEQIEVPLLQIGLLDAFGDQVPSDVQQLFLGEVANYRAFSPAASLEKRMAVMVALILRYADRQCCFDLALEVKVAPDPEATVGLAMREMLRQGMTTPISVKGAGYFVSRLLDGRPRVRAATLENLRSWPRESSYCEVLDYVAPQLEADEFERLCE